MSKILINTDKNNPETKKRSRYRPFSIAYSKDIKSKDWRKKDVTLERFIDKLKTPKVSKLTAAKLDKIKAENPDAYNAIKMMAGGYLFGGLDGNQRKKGNVLYKNVVILDIDNAKPDFFDKFKAAFDCKAFGHTTFSHRENCWKTRLLVFLADDIPPEQYEPIGRKIAEKIGMETIDQTSFQVARLMFFPFMPKDIPYKHWGCDGPLLDPQIVLDMYNDWKDVSEWAGITDGKRLDRVDGKKKQDPTTISGLVGDFCRTYSVTEAIAAFLPHIYASTDRDDNRYTYLAGSTTGGVLILDNDTLLQSMHHSDPCGDGQQYNAFDLVRKHKFGYADSTFKGDNPINAPSNNLMADFARKDTKVIKLQEDNRQTFLELEFADILPEIQALEHGRLLGELLKRVKKVDLIGRIRNEREKVGKKLKGEPSNSEFFVFAVEELIRVSNQDGYSLAAKNGNVYAFNGQYWAKIEAEEFKVFLSKAVQLIGVYKGLAKFVNNIKTMFEQFLQSAVLPPKKGNDKTLINLKNGTYEITEKGGKLREFDRADFLTYQLPFDYDPTAKAPLFNNYLLKVLPDESLRLLLAEHAGSVFTKGLNLEKMAVLYGGGHNGKSVFFNVFTAIVGKENTTNYSLKNLTDNTGYYRAQIANKLVNYGSEISASMNIEKFKQLVSKEAMEARLPYGEPFLMYDYATLIFNANKMPNITEFTLAVWRRFSMIPFEVTISKDEKDSQLADKIISSELSGVFNWVLDGLNRLLKNGRFTHSEKSEAALNDFRTSSDNVALYIEETALEADSDSFVALKDLYLDYKQFCIDNGYRPLGSRNFKKRLESKGIANKRKTQGFGLFCNYSPYRLDDFDEV